MDYYNEYRELLNELYGPVKVAGLEFEAAEVLEKLDPVAFRQGYLDYLDSLVEDGLITEEEAEEAAE